MYHVRRVNIGQTAQLDELAHACGELYSRTLVLDWPWDLPHAVIIHWAGAQYEAIATYHQEEPQTTPQGEQVAGVDLGEFHLAVSHDRELVSELSTSGTSIWTWDQWSGHDTPYGHERCPSRSRSSPRPDGDVPPVVVRSRGVANPRGMSHLCTQAVKT
jgi:hypothetical protein